MILIIDGSNLVFRNFHIFEHLSNHYGYRTGAIYGFFNSLLPYSTNYDKIIVAWEGGSNWRHKIYPDYKGNRKEKEPEKIQALKDVMELCNLSGIIQVKKPNYEADDMVAFLVKKFKTNIRILSGDKDLLQFIDDEKNIAVFRPNPKQGTIEYDESIVKELIGIPKEYISLFLSIVGDDNIKGIKGWGKKTAARIINDEEEPINFIRHAYPAHYETIKRNMKLIDLLNPEIPIGNLDESNLIYHEPDMYQLNKKLFEYEIEAYTSKALIESLSNYEFYNQCKSILLS